MVERWASESAELRLQVEPCQGACGHYTQIVWRDTKEVGMRRGAGGAREVWVCEYNPPGNYVGHRPVLNIGVRRASVIDRPDPLRLERRDLGLVLLDVAQLVHALDQAVLGEASTGNSTARPLGVVSVCFGRSIFTFASGSPRRANSSACTSARHHDRQQRVLQRVLLEDIGEATC